MTRTPIKYKCDGCEAEFPREQLLAKRIQFREMGVSGRVVKTRVVSWLCSGCVEKDPAWSRDSYSEAPGTAAKREQDVTEAVTP